LSELRWNPLLEEWVTVAPLRQDRTYHPPAEHCPLCPTRPGQAETEIPEPDYYIAVFENRFPSYTGEQGRCEVVCYTPDHDSSLGAQSVDHIRDLIEVWRDRTSELSRLPNVKYVYVFENRGEEIGVTLSHPHGQIYAYPFIPPVAEAELRAGRAHFRRHGHCLQCSLVAAERQAAERLLFADDGFAAYVPRYARWPYEVHVAPTAHRGALPDLPAGSRAAAGSRTGTSPRERTWPGPRHCPRRLAPRRQGAGRGPRSDGRPGARGPRPRSRDPRSERAPCPR